MGNPVEATRLKYIWTNQTWSESETRGRDREGLDTVANDVM